LRNVPLTVFRSLIKFLNDENFGRLETFTGLYCPFEALKISEYEIRHSNFIADILDPNKKHGFGDVILKSLIVEILSIKERYEDAAAILVGEISNVQISREWQHIDLLVQFNTNSTRWKTKHYAFVFEFKINSGLHSNQLEEYYEKVTRSFPKADLNFFVISPNGQIGNENKNWQNLDFSIFSTAISNGLQVRKADPVAIELLKSYQRLLRRKGLIDDMELDELAKRIWIEHKQALEFLVERRPGLQELSAHLLSPEFICKINGILAEKCDGLTLGSEESSSRYIRYFVHQWDKFEILNSGYGWVKSGRVLLIEAQITDIGTYIRLVLGKADEEVRNKIYNGLEKNGAPINRRRETITNHYTRINTANLLSRKDIESMLTEDNSSDFYQEKLFKNMSKYLIDNLPKYNLALKRTFSVE